VATKKSPKFNPPSPQRVAERALVLSAVVCRSGIERDAGNAQAEKFRGNVVDWLTQLKLDSETEPAEMELLQTSLGELSQRVLVDTSWRTEGLAVLAWALGKYDLPSYDTQAVGFPIAETLGFMRPREATVLHAPKLRKRKEIKALADQIFALHWRLRQFALHRSAINFEEVARTAWFGPLLKNLPLRDNDLALNGQPLSKTAEPQWRKALSTAQERHQALNWLEGHGVVYSRVSTDT
jgi:uncharacterized protein DUF4272